MAFNVAYYDLLDKNIRHIYSSLPSNIRFRCDPDPAVTLNPHDGCVASHKVLGPRQPPGMPETLYRRLWAYSPEYKASIPRAPAFRCVSSAEAQSIVDRVSQMTKTHRQRRQSYKPQEEEKEKDDDDDDNNDNNDDNAKEDSRAKSAASKDRPPRRCRSVSEMQALTDRVMRPTTASKIRSDLREGHGLNPVEVVTQRSSESDKS